MMEHILKIVLFSAILPQIVLEREHVIDYQEYVYAMRIILILLIVLYSVMML